MTREEAIAEIERLLECAKKLEGPQTFVEFRPVPALEMALAALRPVSRERVERVWGVCDACGIPCNNCERIYEWDRYGKPQGCTGCPENGYKNYTPESQFCEFCGRPLTDEAVEMVMERLEDMLSKE